MHRLQQKLLDVIKNKQIGAMTLRDIASLVGEVYPQKIKHHLMQLEKKGLIEVDKSRNLINIIKSGSSGNFVSVPVLGMASCGEALAYADQRADGFLKVSGNLLKKKDNIFAIQASGLSMNRANISGNNIEDGDYLIVDKGFGEVNNGDVVLSVIDGMANIKEYVWDSENRQIILVSRSNSNISPIYIHEDDNYVISGRVIQVIKKPKI
jgi:repressor LexA